jgi:hypothetical protein
MGMRVLTLAAAAAAVAAAALFWPGGDQVSILDRARAALAGGPVLHLVLQDEAAGEAVRALERSRDDGSRRAGDLVRPAARHA